MGRTNDLPEFPLIQLKNAMNKNSHSIPKHLNEHQTADIIGLSVKTLRRMRYENYGPQYVKLGRRVVYSEIDLGNWLKKNRVETNDAS